jgi:hypothetical protein
MFLQFKTKFETKNFNNNNSLKRYNPTFSGLDKRKLVLYPFLFKFIRKISSSSINKPENFYENSFTMKTIIVKENINKSGIYR